MQKGGGGSFLKDVFNSTSSNQEQKPEKTITINSLLKIMHQKNRSTVRQQIISIRIKIENHKVLAAFLELAYFKALKTEAYL